MARVELSGVKKAFGEVKVIHGIDCTIDDGEFIVILGPSGCGKSTLLRIVAGLERATEGDVIIGGARVNDVEPKDRNIAMVFQNYALYPHMSVYDNMAYGLKIRGLPKADIERRVNEAAQILELSPLLKRKPRQLSGGQRQRVAMGRAIVREPAAFLFDEPLSNLDAKLRVQTRLEIQKLHRRLKTTSLYVTHDQVEAMTLAQRIIDDRTARGPFRSVDDLDRVSGIGKKTIDKFRAKVTVGPEPVRLVDPHPVDHLAAVLGDHVEQVVDDPGLWGVVSDLLAIGRAHVHHDRFETRAALGAEQGGDDEGEDLHQVHGGVVPVAE